MLQSSIIEQLKKISGNENIITTPEELIVYECDALTIERYSPEAVIIPRTAEEVPDIVRLLSQNKIPFIPRGAGTGLSGGTIPTEGGVIIALTNLTRILSIDEINERAIVECGVTNLSISQAVKKFGLHYAPDPSSQNVSTIGGNIAENAGGPHCLKYGMTASHILELEIVLPNGELITTNPDDLGGDITGFLTGAEGTCGIITKATVKLTPLAEAVSTQLVIFDSVRDASETVSEVIATGIIPAAMEMIDHVCLGALIDAFKLDFPRDAKAILLIELDGKAASLPRLANHIAEIATRHNAREVRTAKTEEERMQLWKARKKAFGAIGRVTPSYYTQDGVIPRSKLPDVLDEIYNIGERHGLRIANIFHAGDGNLHPCILFDERDNDETRRCIEAGAEILKLCVAHGGSITGEHGIGIEKMDYIGLMFDERTLAVMKELRNAFNTEGLCNPGKIFPSSHGCMEVEAKHRFIARGAEV